MASAAQIRANRENAKRSTGPRTEAGKQATKFNALVHGLAAESLVIRGEDPSELDALRAKLSADHSPVGETEAMLVEEIAQCWWRLQRARAQETRSITVSMQMMQPFNDGDILHIVRYIAHAERGWHRAITQLRAAQSARLKDECNQPGPAPQPEEPLKVMAVGSVPQSEPEPLSAAVPTPVLVLTEEEELDQIRHSPEFQRFQTDRFMREVMGKIDKEGVEHYERWRNGQI